MGGVFDKLRVRFENQTLSVQNAELVIYASFNIKALPGKTARS